MTTTPCAGKWAIFDSLDPRDHFIARDLCQTCPVILDCARELNGAKEDGGVYGHPQGTWAGQLVIPPTQEASKRLAAISRAEKTAAEDARYSDRDAAQAHSAFTRGDKSEWARTGHRVYDRRRKIRSRRDGAA